MLFLQMGSGTPFRRVPPEKSPAQMYYHQVSFISSDYYQASFSAYFIISLL
jgi:hypothetical protein